MSPPPALLQLDGLHFAYAQHHLFENLQARFDPGVNLVLGGDGRGKTSLLRLLAGELQPQAGVLRWQGRPFSPQAPDAQAKVFWVDPRTDAFDAVSALDFFRLQAQRFSGFDMDLAKGEFADALGLQEHLAKPLYMLSTGSRRKVFLAAAFACGATLTLLDMPFGALDKPSIRFVQDLLTEAAAHPSRAWIVADYEAPPGLQPASTLDLGD